jgi:surface antigen
MWNLHANGTGGRGWAALAALALAGCVAPGPVEGVALDGADRALIESATQQALEQNKVGQGSNWTNPEHGTVGTVTPTRTFNTDTEQPCRDYQQTLTRDGTTTFAYGTACRQGDGLWRNVDAAGPGLLAEGFGRSYSYSRAYRYRPYYSYYPYPFTFHYRHRYGYPYHYGYPGYGRRRGHGGRGGFRMRFGYVH